MQNDEKNVIAKPLASRPFSSSRSFSKLLEDSTTTGSPPVPLPETTLPSRQKTMRLGPPAEVTATMSDASGSGLWHQPDAVTAAPKPAILYKPTAVTVVDGNLDTAHEQMADQGASQPTGSAKSRLSYDGYNWRKYGQKQVKGSEFPRSYYRCTHPTCPVKRKVETSPDGQVAEIVYNGEHNHPRPPHPPKKPSETEARVAEEDAGGDGPSGGCNYASKGSGLRSCSCMDGVGEMCESGECKKREGNQTNDASSMEPHPSLKSSTECEISVDRFHWRKYGQKAVKGNSFPRSYYRCSMPRCDARKYVERASDESGSLVTTYEGRHNHDVPMALTTTTDKLDSTQTIDS